MATANASGKFSGKAGTIVTLAVLTVLAVGAGCLVGKLLIARLRPPPPPTPAATATAPANPAPYANDVEMKELPPLITNLAEPNRSTEVRLQVSIVYVRKAVDNPAVLMARIGDDIVAFLKTVSLTQIQGASGLQNLREDLNERAAIRSQGGVREVIIEALVTR